MDDTKSLIEKYKRELMELGKTAKTTPEREVSAVEQEKPTSTKNPTVIGYVSEEGGEFPAVFDRIIAEAVANEEIEDRRDSPEGYPDIDSPEDDIAFSAGIADNTRESGNAVVIRNGNATAQENVRKSNNAVVIKKETARPEENQNQGTGETISNFPVSTYSTYEEFEARNTGGGSLVFMVFTASEALPVEGAAVTVSTRIDGEPREMFTCVTNNSGETEARTLPAPSKSLSQEYDNKVQPFSLYDATVSKEGFTKVILRDIPVFDGVRSIQRVAMIPAENLDNDGEVRNAE